MRKLLWIGLFLAFCVADSTYAAASISADFVDGKGEKIGTATLKTLEDGTLITVDVRLPKGAYAIHVHENGACAVPDFKSAGGHFNPDGHKHSFDNKDGFHAGDLTNLFVESTGHIKADMFSTHLHLTGTNGLGHGTAIVIHEKADDYSGDPSGNAGSRIACAVVKQ